MEKIKDNILIKDEFSVKNTGENKGCSLKGHIIFRDPITKEIVGEKDNLVLLRGRSYILELLFGQTVSSDSGFINDKDRTVCLFKVGQGGSDINSSPLQVIAPKFSDTDLYQPVPFVVEDPNKDIDPSKLANPSFVKELSSEQKKVYYMATEQPDNSTRYFAKTFDSDSKRLKVNKATGEVYEQLTLSITPSECRGFVVNELGLVLARYDEGTNTYINCELFSHVTFDPYILSSLKRGVLIEYLIYA